MLLRESLPTEESPEAGLKVVVLAQSNRELLASNVVSQQVLSLDRKLVNGFIHALKPRLS